MRRMPDDLRHPSGGERLQGAAGDAVRIAHRALDRFPELVRRHKFIAGGAAVSSSLVVLAGVAVARRMRSGQSEQEAIDSLTEEELAGRRSELPAAAAPDGDAPAGPPAAAANGAAPGAEPRAEPRAATAERGP